MVLGANLGSALNPLLNAAAGRAGRDQRLPLGNLINRLTGCALALPLLTEIAGPAGGRPMPARGRIVVLFHLAFNVALAALVHAAAARPSAGLLERLLPDRPGPTIPRRRAISTGPSLATPAVALANAARETLRMADVVETCCRAPASCSTRTTSASPSGSGAWTTCSTACTRN